jgi:hypothetical protein
MAHGQADYTTTTRAKIVDASVEFDLPVIMLDRFESANFLWTGVGTGAGWSAARAAASAYEGDAGMELVTRAPGGLAGDLVEALRYFFPAPIEKLSLSALFRPNKHYTILRELRFWIELRNMTYQYFAGVRWRGTDRAWDYFDDVTGWTEMIPLIRHTQDTWHRMTIEMDIANLHYISFSIDDLTLSLHDRAIRQNVIAGQSYASIAIRAVANFNADPADVDIDNVIIKEIGT